MFHWIELRAFCHATEDEDRVVAALRTVSPEGEVRRDTLEGHFGNPIVALTVRAERTADTDRIWRGLVDALGGEALADLDKRLDDDGVYHLRIDKQAACRGRIEPARTDDVIAIRAKVAAFPKKRDVAVKVLRGSVAGR